MTDSDEPETLGGPLDHIEELEAYVRSLPPAYSRRLVFSEQCGLAFALKANIQTDVVKEAFGLSSTTISYLKTCLEEPDRPPAHYRDVWTEYYALGDDRFRVKYYTAELHARLRRIWEKKPRAGDIAVKRTGPDPRAGKYSFENYGPIEINGVDWGVFMCNDVDPPGWYCRALDQREGWVSFVGLHTLYGREAPEPFANSSLAFDALYETQGYPSPRPKPGRRKTP